MLDIKGLHTTSCNYTLNGTSIEQRKLSIEYVAKAKICHDMFAGKVMNKTKIINAHLRLYYNYFFMVHHWVYNIIGGLVK